MSRNSTLKLWATRHIITGLFGEDIAAITLEGADETCTSLYPEFLCDGSYQVATTTLTAGFVIAVRTVVCMN